MSLRHSVENCQVRDNLQIDHQYGLVVVATEFAESRTGLPYAAFGDEVFERRPDGFIIRNMHRRIPEIYQWVHTRYENTLEINEGDPIALATLGGNTLLHIHVVNRSAQEWALMQARLLWQHRSF